LRQRCGKKGAIMQQSKGWRLQKHWPLFFMETRKMNELDTLVQDARQAFARATTAADLENAKALFLGKSGRSSTIFYLSNI